MRAYGSIAIGLLLACAAPVTAGSGEMVYFVEDGRVVVTNVEEEAPDDARPVPRAQGSGVYQAPTPPEARRQGGTRFDEMIAAASRETGLPEKLIASVVRAESAFDPRAVSHKGAQGLMQLMPATARQYGVDNAFDPFDNVRAGSRHLRYLLDKFDDLDLALAAYNAGEGAVRRAGGIPAYRETRDYVRKVRAWYDGAAPRADGGVPRRAPARPIRVQHAADGSLVFSNQ